MTGTNLHPLSPEAVTRPSEPVVIASVSGRFTVEWQQGEVWLACVASDFCGEPFAIGITARAIDGLMQCLATARDALLDQSMRDDQPLTTHVIAQIDGEWPV